MSIYVCCVYVILEWLLRGELQLTSHSHCYIKTLHNTCVRVLRAFVRARVHVCVHMFMRVRARCVCVCVWLCVCARARVACGRALNQ